MLGQRTQSLMLNPFSAGTHFRRQNLKCLLSDAYYPPQVIPRTEIIIIFVMAVDP